MIEAMRGPVAKWIIRILAVFLIMSFAVWGVGDMFRARAPEQTVANVGDSVITFDEAQTQINRLMTVMRQRVGPDFDLEQAARLGLVDQTIDEMVNTRLLELEAKRMGLAAGEDLIRSAIYADPRFRGPGNQFSKLAYEQILRQEGMSEGVFVGVVRQNLLRQQITSPFVVSAHVPQAMLDTLYRYRSEKRTAAVVTVPAGAASDVPDPAPATLAEFHKNNPEQFTQPEYRTVTMIYLDPEKAARELKPSEQRIKEEYEYRKETLGVPERRKLEQVLVQDEETARKIARSAGEGRALADAARENDATVSDLGTLARRDLPKEIAEKAFALPQGGVSQPIRTALGWHIVHVDSISPGRTPTMEELRPGIVKDISRELAIDNFIGLTAKLDDTLAAGGSLEDAAAAIGVSTIRIPAIDASGNDADGKPLTDIPRTEDFTDQVFAAQQGQVSHVEESRNGGFYVFRVDAVTPPKLQPLDEVREQAVAAWKESQVMDVARRKAEALAKEARTPGSLEKAAQDAGLTVTNSEPFTRFIRETGSAVSPALASEIFDAKKGDVVVAAAGDGFAVGQLKEIIPAEPGKNEAEAQALRNQLQDTVARDQIDQYLTALRQRYSVKIYPDIVQQLVTGRTG